MRRLEEQRHVSTAAAIEKSGTADTMGGQKSGPALAGPAAPATTALRPTRQTISYYQNIMKILYAKYHFVCHVGQHLKIKKKTMCSEMVKNRPKKCKMCSIYGSSARCHDNTCGINEELVLVFKRGNVAVLGIVF